MKTMFDWVKILDNLSDVEKKQLEVFCQEKRLKSWEVLFEEWDVANAMYFLVEWEMEVYKNIYWKKTVLWKILSEDILWEMAIFWTEWKRMASAKAIKDSILIVILSFSIKELTKQHPEIMEKIKEIIEVRNLMNKSKELN